MKAQDVVKNQDRNSENFLTNNREEVINRRKSFENQTKWQKLKIERMPLTGKDQQVKKEHLTLTRMA